jgi:hypothetical protein
VQLCRGEGVQGVAAAQRSAGNVEEGGEAYGGAGGVG